MRPAELLARVEQLKQNEMDRPVAEKQSRCEPDPIPETLFFRSQTIAIVRHFFEVSCQVGRLPSILGREFFRAKVSHHAIPSFEDQAVFVHDVEACLKQLNEGDAQIVTMVGLHGLSKEEVGALLRCSRNWINVSNLESLDALTQIFLDAGVLSRRKPDRQTWQMSHRTLPNLADGSSPKKPCESVKPCQSSAALPLRTPIQSAEQRFG